MHLKQHHFVYAGLAALAVVSVLILYLGYVSYGPINRTAAAQITRGMTERDVERIFGGPCSSSSTMPARQAGDQSLPARTFKLWRDERAQCAVLFDAAGRVIAVSFHEDAAPGPLDRLRAFFGR